MIVSLIVAMDERRGIGKQNRLPWHLSSDLKRFKHLTMGHHLVMGRKTYETIGVPLPGRQMVVVTRQKDYQAPGCLVAHSLRKALKIASDQHENEVFIIGGGDIFRQAIRLADKIYLTAVHSEVDADITFPPLDFDQWEITYSQPVERSDKDDFQTDFKILLRRNKS